MLRDPTSTPPPWFSRTSMPSATQPGPISTAGADWAWLANRSTTSPDSLTLAVPRSLLPLRMALGVTEISISAPAGSSATQMRSAP